MPDDNFGSSIPPGASVYRYPPKKITLNGSNIQQGGVVATIIHQPRGFRTFQNNGDPFSFLVNFRTHVNVSLNPNRLQTLQFSSKDGRLSEISLFAEELQFGYAYKEGLVQRAKDAFAPPTYKETVTDTTTSTATVNINEGLAFNFDVSESVTVSVTDWLVSLNPAAGNVSWDYVVRTPYNLIAGERPPEAIDKLSNTSLIGFSFDTIAWFEIFDLTQTSVDFRPSFRLRVSHRKIEDVFGEIVTTDETSFLGDADIANPSAPPLVIDLTKIPNRTTPKL
jgi:hypothetical protein